MVGWAHRKAQEVSEPGLEEIVSGSPIDQCHEFSALNGPFETERCWVSEPFHCLK